MNKILIAAVILLSLAIAFLVYSRQGITQPSYYAVYLKTGDFYFGKLNHFPSLSLSDAWFLEKGNGALSSLKLSKFTEAFWEPSGKIYLNDDEVVWFAPLRSDGQIVNYIKNPSSGRSLSPEADSIPLSTSTARRDGINF